MGICLVIFPDTCFVFLYYKDENIRLLKPFQFLLPLKVEHVLLHFACVKKFIFLDGEATLVSKNNQKHIILWHLYFSTSMGYDILVALRYIFFVFTNVYFLFQVILRENN